MEYPHFLSIDIETTGLDPNWCQILSIGGILFNEESVIESFEHKIKYDSIVGEQYALDMNENLIRECATEGSSYHFVKDKFIEFMDALPKPTFALGFNVSSFDIPFLEHKGFSTEGISHRRIEMGTLLISDDGIPSSSNRAVPEYCGHDVHHTALGDARDAAYIFAHKMRMPVKIWIEEMPI